MGLAEQVQPANPAPVVVLMAQAQTVSITAQQAALLRQILAVVDQAQFRLVLRLPEVLAALVIVSFFGVNHALRDYRK